MATYSGVIPLLHKECKLLGKVPLLLDDTIAVRSVRAEHVGAIISKRKNLSDRVNVQTKCILIDGGAAPLTAEQFDDIGLCGSFVLNAFSEEGAIVLGPGFSIRHIRAHVIELVHDINAYAPDSTSKYEIESDISPELLKVMFQATRTALSKDPTLRISLRKFNSSLLKLAVEDRILDMSICLESMVRLDTEISFRFSLYNALLADVEPAGRREAFTRLKRFYRERSNLVHGNSEADETWLHANWAAIVKIAKLAILEKVVFLETHQPADWQPHLDGLAFGKITQQEEADG